MPWTHTHEGSCLRLQRGSNKLFIRIHMRYICSNYNENLTVNLLSWCTISHFAIHSRCWCKDDWVFGNRKSKVLNVRTQIGALKQIYHRDQCKSRIKLLGYEHQHASLWQIPVGWTELQTCRHSGSAITEIQKSSFGGATHDQRHTKSKTLTSFSILGPLEEAQ